MTSEDPKQTLQFQAEVTKLLHLMVHSLYSNKEIFLRELISNGVDACDKLRFEALSNDALMKGDPDLRIQIEVDEAARTLIVRDNGIGMSRDEIVANIGTIARSGTREFFESLNAEQVKDARLIGQFGVGFYSSFIVADRVTILSRRAGLAADAGVRWESEGLGSYSVEQTTIAWRGTEVRLHLKEGEAEFLDDWRLRALVHKYSDHVPLSVQLRRSDDKGKPGDEWETVNKASALWLRPRQEISEREYREFYEQVTYDPNGPLAWAHFKVEGKLEYSALLYTPAKAPHDLFDRDVRHGVKLYVQRVFIMDDAEKLMPRYLRFVRGVIDSSDLPLNVSREILQGNKILDGIRAGCVKKLLAQFAEMAEQRPEQYATFWQEFGAVLKEGPGEDYANREDIAKLLRFASTHADTDVQNVSLADYLARMKPGQNKIYYLTADSFSAVQHSPHLEVFRKKQIEVLLLFHRVDEWLVAQLREFEGKPLQSVAKGELDLGGIESEGGAEEVDAARNVENASELTSRIKQALGDKVETVRASERLTRSPACIVLDDQDMALYMQRLLKQAGHAVTSHKPVLEVNTGHPILRRLKEEQDDARFADWSGILLDQAILAEGGQLEDPAGFVSRLNDLVLGLAQ